MAPAAPRHALVAFASVAFAYYGYAGLYATYAPLWFQSLGFGTLAIGSLVALQNATRLAGPYIWGWLADHHGERVRLLQIAIGGALMGALGYFVSVDYVWIAVATVALFACTAGIVPISEAALAYLVSHAGGTLDVGRYGRVRLWGSLGFIVAVVGSGALLQALGIVAFRWLMLAVLAALFVAALRLPPQPEAAASPAESARGALAVLRQPAVAWFFAGIFCTVLAHVALYAFLSLYLASLGYSKTAIGLYWGTGVAAEVVWFWFQGRWFARLTPHGWLTLAAAATALRLPLVAVCGARPVLLALLQCSHALTFAAQHSACTAMLNRHFPGRLRGRGQALYAVLGYGVSGVIGGLAGGALSEAHGYPAVFWAAGGAGLAAIACNRRAAGLERHGIGGDAV